MRVLWIIVGLLSMVFVHGQSVPRLLEVTDNKTTNLVFPSAIASVDRGSERIIVQKSNGNVLRVKADTSFTDTTNLTIITADGKLYSFLVCFHHSPSQLMFDFGSGERIDRDTALVALAKTTIAMRSYLHGVRFVSGKVRMSLGGVYTNSNVILCKLKLDNSSSLSFEIGRIRVSITGRQQSKRRPVQERDVDILMVQEECPVIKQKQSCTVVVVLPKAALSPGQALRIDLQEKGGERHLSITIPNKHIINARVIEKVRP